jgi:hypothetical protein
LAGRSLLLMQSAGHMDGPVCAKRSNEALNLARLKIWSPREINRRHGLFPSFGVGP